MERYNAFMAFTAGAALGMIPALLVFGSSIALASLPGWSQTPILGVLVAMPLGLVGFIVGGVTGLKRYRRGEAGRFMKGAGFGAVAGIALGIVTALGYGVVQAFHLTHTNMAVILSIVVMNAFTSCLLAGTLGALLGGAVGLLKGS